MRLFWTAAALTCLAGVAHGQETAPYDVPATRQQMKVAIDAWKRVKPRLPLPPLTAEEKKKQGDRPVVNNGRMKMLYLPAELRGSGFKREPDKSMSLDYSFKTMLFWIVSRTNNCHY